MIRDDCETAIAEMIRENELKTELRINSELDACGMAYKIRDKEGNQFVYAGMENGLPAYRTGGEITHIMDLVGYEVVEKHIKL